MMNLFPILRSILGALCYPMWIIIITILIVVLGISSQWRNTQDKVVGAWARVSLWLFGVKVKGHYLERLPPQGQGYLALFNHTSNFDILAVQTLIPRIRFGAKIELFKIPLFGLAMKASGALAIARSNREEVLRVYDGAKMRMTQGGESFILSPEGTRQPTEKLGPFKSGPFLLAIASQRPVVPIAIRGASAIQPKGKKLPNSERWHSTIEVFIGEPISTQGLTVESKQDLQNKVRESFIGLGLD